MVAPTTVLGLGVPLLPGDVLLYRPVSFFGAIIAMHTWHRVSHVEVYLGHGLSSASRDGLGVNIYPVRLSQLAYVLRPTVPVDAAALVSYTESWRGTPYGWRQLLDYFGISTSSRGIICSPWATLVLRRAGVNIFPADDPRYIAPFQFLDALGGLLSLVASDAVSPAASA